MSEEDFVNRLIADVQFYSHEFKFSKVRRECMSTRRVCHFGRDGEQVVVDGRTLHLDKLWDSVAKKSIVITDTGLLINKDERFYVFRLHSRIANNKNGTPLMEHELIISKTNIDKQLSEFFND